MALTLNPKIEIKDSPIKGKGIFAKGSFKKGEEVWISKGEEPAEAKIYTDDEFKKFTEWCIANDKEWDAVSLGDGRHRVALSDREKHPGNYGNHSCDPNVKPVDDTLIALRDITPGDEITVDYTQFSTKDWSMECNCGSKNCKGLVRGKL